MIATAEGCASLAVPVTGNKPSDRPVQARDNRAGAQRGSTRTEVY